MAKTQTQRWESLLNGNSPRVTVTSPRGPVRKKIPEIMAEKGSPKKLRLADKRRTEIKKTTEERKVAEKQSKAKLQKKIEGIKREHQEATIRDRAASRDHKKRIRDIRKK